MNKKKRCVFCRDYFYAEGMTKVPAGWFCLFDHVLAYANRKKEKAAKKAHTVAKKEFYASDRGKQLKAAQTAFNAFIRYRDKDRDCISCGQYVRMSSRQAGHYRTFKGLRFNQFNCHLQCIHCNMYLSANIVEYRIRLVKKIGVEKVEWLESQNEPLKLTIDDINSIRIYYTKLLKRLKESN